MRLYVVFFTAVLLFLAACSSIPTSDSNIAPTWKSTLPRADITHFTITGKLLARTPSHTLTPLRFSWQESPNHTSILLENTLGVTLANIQRQTPNSSSFANISSSLAKKDDGRYWLISARSGASKTAQPFDTLEAILSHLFGETLPFPAGILLDLLLARRQTQWNDWKMHQPSATLDWQIRNHHKTPLSNHHELPQYINITYTHPSSSQTSTIRLFIESWYNVH